jgi:hypothetical protein
VQDLAGIGAALLAGQAATSKLENFPLSLSLSHYRDDGGAPSPWVGAFIRMGARVARYARHYPDRQLIIALSVPCRDFAAALIGCGWTLASSPPPLDSPQEELRRLETGASVRVVTKDRVLLTRITGSTHRWPLVEFGNNASFWNGEDILALSAAPSIGRYAELDRVPPGTIGRLSARRLARPTEDLAIVARSRTSLRAEMSAYLSCESIPGAKATRLADLLLPDDPDAATWSARLYSARGFDGALPDSVRAVILDGTSAVRRLRDITVPVVFCIVDRSVADESTAEDIVQYRNTGEALSLRDDIGQVPPPGVEVLAFTVAP